MESLPIGARVERCNSPADSRVKDGVRGTVKRVHEAVDGQMGYEIQIDGDPPGAYFFCAGTRLKAVAES
jgi:hypothetical protein